jgi:[acyl-carrier-protein] S-malonyltransferase
MVGSGVDTFVEIGPGRALSGMVKRINRRAKTSNVTDLDSILELRRN